MRGTLGRRPCPMNNSCRGFRKTGEIFCHKCYFKLPKELRDALWARNLHALSATIDSCKQYLTLLGDW